VDGVIISGSVVTANPVDPSAERTIPQTVVLTTSTLAAATGNDQPLTAADRAFAGHRILPAAGTAGDNHGSRL
jgi:hypothetical protein